MASHYPSNSFSNETNTHQLDTATEIETLLPKQRLLDESVQTHMCMIGSILAQIIRDWSAAQNQEIQSTSDQSS